MDIRAPFTLTRPAAPLTPLVLTSPHSGQFYDAEFLALSRLDATAIRQSEDSFVEELFAAGPALGAPLLAANFPRAWCDANREKWELDPAMFVDVLPDFINGKSPRVAAGLGTIARIVGTGEAIYARKLSFADAQARISDCWVPYHAALRRLIDDTVQSFGTCLVIDCHSMPSLAGRGQALPDIVLGDGHGTACALPVTAFMQAELTRLGFSVRRNDPYAGGYITRHYGRPRENVHVVQIEVARGLYMDERRFAKTAGFTILQNKLTAFLRGMAAAAARLTGGEPGIAAAAE